MNDATILEKLINSPRHGQVCELNDYDRRRMGGAQTNYIPTPAEVAHVIKAIPAGATKTIRELRNDLARLANTETTCPAATLKYWKWMANLSDEQKLKYQQYDIPWWRVLKDGKLSRHMPGGIENQRNMLEGEGGNSLS